MSKFYKMRDKSDNLKVFRDDLFNQPFRLLVIGKTGSGKSNILGNLLLLNEMYRKSYLPEDIYIFSGSLDGDKKLEIIIEELDIPKENLFNSFSEDVVGEIYDMLVDDYNQQIADREKPTHKLLIFDDLSFDGSLKGRGKNDQINRIFCNGRKFLISTICVAQKYSDISTCARENASSMILFKSSNKQLELIESDMNYLNGQNGENLKRKFIQLVKSHTKGSFDFIIIDLEKPNIYFDSNYKPIQLN